jgi:hypothetical protein
MKNFVTPQQHFYKILRKNPLLITHVVLRTSLEFKVIKISLSHEICFIPLITHGPHYLSVVANGYHIISSLFFSIKLFN